MAVAVAGRVATAMARMTWSTDGLHACWTVQPHAGNGRMALEH